MALIASLLDIAAARWLFVHGSYYCLWLLVLCWMGVWLHAARGLRWPDALGWVRENWPGIVVAVLVTASVGLAVEPALRMLSDEANLVGVSKNLFASKTATFTVSGKYYYGSYWDVDVAIDRRPTLFPFLVSLVHSVLGYSYRNAFLLNLALLPAFLLVSYRLAKSLGGETFGVVAALLVSVHPITLLSVRSGGFDFCALFFGVLVVHSVLAFIREQAPLRLALLWLHLCLFAEVRYESVLFMAPVLLVLFAFKLVRASTLQPYAFVYALTPLYLMPRAWQSLLRGNVPEQDPGTVTFSLGNFLANVREYFEPLWSPLRSYPAHSTVAIATGVLGTFVCLHVLFRRRRGVGKGPEMRFLGFLAAFMTVQAIVVFTYFWGRAQYPSAARLVIGVDTFFSFMAAWFLTTTLGRFRPWVAILLAAALFLAELPVAAQGRFLNRLTQTRESAATWDYFEKLDDPRILIVTDRPNHFTIMNYGAMSFEAARKDAYLFTAWQRRLFSDVYVIQQIQLSTGTPLPGYELWTDRPFDVAFEFQNDADVLVRISRLSR
jgi:hypothetical protein